MQRILQYRWAAPLARLRLVSAASIVLAAVAACSQAPPPPSQIAAPAPISRQKDALNEKFREAVDALPTGVLVYNVPSSMRVGKSQVVGVVVSQSFAPSIQRDLAGNGPTAVTSVRIASGMKAFLVATPSAAFTITPKQNDNEEQTLDPDGRIAWSWEVLPVSAGESELDIEIEAGVQIAGESERFFRTVKRVKIPVTAKPVPEQLFDFASANWQWLLSTLLLPWGIWAFRELAARSKQRTPSA